MMQTAGPSSGVLWWWGGWTTHQLRELGTAEHRDLAVAVIFRGCVQPKAAGMIC